MTIKEALKSIENRSRQLHRAASDFQMLGRSPEVQTTLSSWLDEVADDLEAALFALVDEESDLLLVDKTVRAIISNPEGVSAPAPVRSSSAG